MEKKIQKKDIVKTLSSSDSWNGVASNGTPYTQWEATEEFFQLWKEHKDEIKAEHFSLYKNQDGEWLVTLFGTQEGEFSSRKEYDLECYRDELMEMTDDEDIIEEIQSAKSREDLMAIEEEYRR